MTKYDSIYVTVYNGFLGEKSYLTSEIFLVWLNEVLKKKEKK